MRVLCLLALLTGIAAPVFAQNATGYSAPGRLGKISRIDDSLPPLILLEATEGARLAKREQTDRGISIVPDRKAPVEYVSRADGRVVLRGTVTDNYGVRELRVNNRKMRMSGPKGRRKFVIQLPLPPAGKTRRLRFIAIDEAGNKAESRFAMRGPSEGMRSALLLDVSAPQSAPPTDVPDKQPAAGKYWALVIGVGDYAHPSVKDLKFPLQDAKDIANVLSREYTFDPSHVNMLTNPTRSQLIGALADYTPNGRFALREQDNLLVFYAGHGFWDENYREGYWLPADAQQQNRANWISNSDIQRAFRAIGAQHILLLSDACFSGSLFATREPFTTGFQEMYREKSRKAITAGNLTVVPDKSVFKEYIMKRLTGNSDKYLDAGALYNSIKLPVTNNSRTRQRPIYGTIQETGDEGGEFIFVRR